LRISPKNKENLWCIYCLLKKEFSFTLTALRLIQLGGTEALGKIPAAKEVSKIWLNSGESMVCKFVRKIILYWQWTRDNGNLRR
jgi:molybdenum cofactor biosynthesis enzyme MoaA